MNPTATIAWQVAWPLSPAVVGIAAATAMGAILLTARGWRPAAARVGIVVLLVVMHSGLHRVAPQGQQASAASNEQTPPHLVDCVVPAVAWMGESLDVQAVAWVATAGQQPPAALQVVELIDSQGEVISTASLEPGSRTATPPASGGQLWRARLPWQPREAGVQQLAIRWADLRPTSPAAAVSFPAWNSAISAVCGVAAGPLRVLLIDSVARWETRHLKRLLSSTEGIEATHVMLEADASGSLPRSRQAAAEYDAVVLGSFDPRDLPEATVEAIVEAAREDGLGVVWSLDARSDLASLAASPLGAVLPCGPAALPQLLPATTGRRVLATPAAAGFPWLDPLLKAIEQTQAEVFLPAAITLREPTAISPLRLTAVAPSAANPATTEPALLVDHTGMGRVVVSLCETWRYRGSGCSRLVDTFWRSALRFVAEPRARLRQGAELAAAAANAETQQRERRREWPASQLQPPAGPSRQPLWNHPVLVAMVIGLAAASWLLPGRTATSAELTAEHTPPP